MIKYPTTKNSAKEEPQNCVNIAHSTCMKILKGNDNKEKKTLYFQAYFYNSNFTNIFDFIVNILQ